MATSFHLDHGDGMDGYGVGPSLGCGAPALMKDGALLMPWCWQQYRILDNGPLRFTVELQFYPFDESNADKALSLGAGQTKANVQPLSFTEHRLISLDKGSNYNRCTVWYEGLKAPVNGLSFCSGVVLQREDPAPVVLESRYVSYTDPTDQPNLHQAPLYVAALFPEGDIETRRQHGHALGVLPGYDGSRFTYYFGSAWAKYDVRTPEEWRSRIQWFMRGLQTPLLVTLRDASSK